MKITKEEAERIMKELEKRHCEQDTFEDQFYKNLAKNLSDNCFVDMLRNNDTIILYDIMTFRLIEVDVIKIQDNKLILNI